jgi:hypothetical protein
VNEASQVHFTESLVHAVNKLTEDVIYTKSDDDDDDGDDDDDDVLSSFHPFFLTLSKETPVVMVVAPSPIHNVYKYLIFLNLCNFAQISN